MLYCLNNWIAYNYKGVSQLQVVSGHYKAKYLAMFVWSQIPGQWGYATWPRLKKETSTHKNG